MADDLVQEILDFRSTAYSQWADILAEAETDMEYVSGNPWDEKDKKAREQAGRPCLTLDELNQYFNQAINDLRSNPLGVNFAPTGNGANDEGAEFYQNKMREIEYRSSAQIAYITAAENMFQQGMGWVRVNTKWQRASWAQDIWIEPIMNPAQILPGRHVWPDGRDLTQLLYIEPYSQAEFRRQFPKARAVNFNAEDVKQATQWTRGDEIDVAEYWRKEPYDRTLLMLRQKRNPRAPIVSVYKDAITPKGKKEPAIPDGYVVARERTEEDFKIYSCLTNGVEILKETPWAGRHIPFVSFYGKILYVNGTRVILSMTRLARDPYMAYCFYRTCEMEMAGIVTKNPYWAYENQLTPDMMTEIQKSLHEPVAVLTAKVTVPGAPPGQLLPLPQRNPLQADIQSYGVAAEEMRRSIQAAMGISPQPTEVQRRNDISGEAWKQRMAQSQKGSFHFVDHYKGGIQRVGMIVEDLMDKIYDTDRTVWVHEADETPRQVRINNPADPKSISTKGDYLVTVSAGPSFDSQRDAADDFVNDLLGNLQTIAQLRGPDVASGILALSIKLKQLGPIGNQIADLIEPPSFKSEDGQPPDPRLLQAQGTIQQLQQQLQEAGFVIKTKQVEGQTRYAIEQMKTQATSADKAADREVKLVVAELGAKVDRMALLLEASAKIGVRLDAQHADVANRTHEALQAGHQRAHEAVEAAKDRAHEHVQARLAHADAAEMLAAQPTEGAGAAPAGDAA